MPSILHAGKREIQAGKEITGRLCWKEGSYKMGMKRMEMRGMLCAALALAFFSMSMCGCGKTGQEKHEDMDGNIDKP